MSKSNKKEPNFQKIENAVRILLNTLNEELGWFNNDNEALENTPRRITQFYKEWYENTLYNKWTTFDFDEPELLDISNNHILLEENISMDNDTLLSYLLSKVVSITDIEYVSLCSHHMLPYFGKVDVYYIPKNKVIGASKIPRAVRYVSSKPSIQEGITRELTNFLYERINPYFILVRMRDTVHTCMTIRGVKTCTSKMNTINYKYDEKYINSSIVPKLVSAIINSK